MSAIGDYIHFYTSNYVKHGTYRTETGQSNYYNALQILQNRHYILLQQLEQQGSRAPLTKEERQTIESALTGLTKADNGQHTAAQDVLWRILVEQLENKFGEAADAIVRDTLSTNGRRFADINRIRLNKDQKRISKARLESIIGNLNDAIEALSDPQTKQEYLIKITEIKNDLATIEQEIVNNTGKKLDSNFHIDLTALNTAQGNLITRINNLIGIGRGTRARIQGDAFEYALALVPLLIKGTVINRLDRFARYTLKKNVVGGNRSRVEIDTRQFIDGLDWSTILKSGYRQQELSEYMYESTLPTQDKVDVQFRLFEKDLFVSAKNINLYSGYGITLVKNTSLLTLLAAQGDNDFTNHFLNIAAANDPSDLSSAIIQAAHQGMRSVVLLQALIGYKGSQATNLFIVNDNTTGRVRVFNISTLLQALNTEGGWDVLLHEGRTAAENIYLTDDFKTLALENVWSTSYEQRITRLLRSVHRRKITVTLQPDQLIKIYNNLS